MALGLLNIPYTKPDYLTLQLKNRSWLLTPRLSPYKAAAKLLNGREGVSPTSDRTGHVLCLQTKS